MKLSDIQLLLLHYAEFYKSIFELPATERPDMVIIENDAKLDRWYSAFIAELARKSGRNARNSGAIQIPNYSE